MSDEPSNPDWLLERIPNLNGQVVASHMMTAILFYTLRTGAPVESIYRNIQSFRACPINPLPAGLVKE